MSSALVGNAERRLDDNTCGDHLVNRNTSAASCSFVAYGTCARCNSTDSEDAVLSFVEIDKDTVGCSLPTRINDHPKSSALVSRKPHLGSPGETQEHIGSGMQFAGQTCSGNDIFALSDCYVDRENQAVTRWLREDHHACEFDRVAVLD